MSLTQVLNIARREYLARVRTKAFIIMTVLVPAFLGVYMLSVPLDCYWCCAGDAFEFVVLQSDQQVTMIVTTPDPPGQHPTGFPHLEKIWMVKTATPGNGEKLEDGANGIFTIQLKTDDTLP